MARDVNEFISEALKDGYKIEDVVGFMSKHEQPEYQSWAQNWQSKAAAPEYQAGAMDMQGDFESGKADIKGRYEGQKKELTSTEVGGFSVPSLLSGPATYIGLGALGTAAVGFGVSKLKNRSIKNPQVAEAVGNAAKAEAAPVDYSIPAYQRKAQILDTAGVAAPEPKPLSPMENLQARKEQILSGLQQNAPQGSVPPAAAPATAPAPVQPTVAPVAVEPAPVTATEAVATGQSPSKAIQMDVAQQLDATPVEGAAPPKKGRKPGSKNLTVEEKAAQEAAKGINMYRNMFGFDTKNPQSPKSLAAIEATNRFISEGFEGRAPASRDPFLNPATDLKASGEKFYSGLPEGYRNVYVPWLEKNLNTLPPEVQSHVLQSMTKGQTKDLGKIIKGLGIAGAALGAYQTAFAQTPQDRAMAGANLMGAILPPGADILEAGAPGVPQSRFDQAALLGSPYAQTEWAKQKRKAIQGAAVPR